MRVDGQTKRQVRRLDPQRIAQWLGLEAHRSQKNKYRCPWCGPGGDSSGDNLHVNPKGAYEPDGRKCAAKCFSCGATCSDTIAFAREMHGWGFVEAVEWLCGNAGIPFDAGDQGSGPPTSTPAPSPSPTNSQPDNKGNAETAPEAPPQALTDWLMPRTGFDTFRRLVDAYRRQLADLSRPPALAMGYTVMADVWGRMNLDPEAAAYLKRRGISPETAGSAGVRSTTFDQWARLRDDYPPRLLEHIGFNYRFVEPDGSFEHVLWFPYFDRHGRISTLRWRELGDGNVKNMRSSGFDDDHDGLGPASPHRPSTFYLAPDALEAAKGRETYIWLVEGELDALSVWAAGRPAMAAPGSNWIDAGWWEALRSAPGVVIAGDGDDSGKKFTKLAKRRAAESLGRLWAETNIGRAHWRPDWDANDLLQKGRLAPALSTLENEWQINESRRPETDRPAAV